MTEARRVVIAIDRIEVRERAANRCGLAAGVCYGMAGVIMSEWDAHGWSMRLSLSVAFALAALVYSVVGMPPRVVAEPSAPPLPSPRPPAFGHIANCPCMRCRGEP